MLEVFDRNRRRVAIAENAHNVTEERKINSLWNLTFSLPANDAKNDYCLPFYYVRWNGGQLYRIMPSEMTVTETGTLEYQCEHVLSTLLDTVMFGHHTVGNVGTYTADCINYVLNRQNVRNWVLSACDFRRQFEYSWEQENLLSALFSIATPLENYMWVTDTGVYPWRLSLKAINTSGHPDIYIRRRYNMLSYDVQNDPQQICTRLYPLGYGEGVNQLNIKDVNNGIPYLQSPKSYTDKYGIIERVWIDRRYEDAQSLKAAAQAMLTELQEPSVSYEVGFAELDSASKNTAAMGKKVRILHPESNSWTDTYITGLNYNYSDITQSMITVANKSISIATSVADLADRQRIEQAYAQGATQLYSQALQANCDKENGAIMDFFIPDEMRIINKVLVKIRMGRFLSYSKSTESAAEFVGSTSTSSEIYSTSSAGGGERVTSDSGGEQTTTSKSSTFVGQTGYSNTQGVHATDETKLSGSTSTAGGKMTSHAHSASVEAHLHNISGEQPHKHQIENFSHNHKITIEPHSHDVNISAHTHKFTIPAHRHQVPIPAHSHDIIPGIYEFGDAKSFSIYVNGTKKASYVGKTAELNITDYLLGDDKRIPRGSWMSIEVRPDDLAYISIDLVFQGFVQSRGDAAV